MCSLMEMFKLNDSLQLAYIYVPAGHHARQQLLYVKLNHERNITIILYPMVSFLKAVQ